MKILDFGIAKMLQGAQATTTKATGTPLYMAPEQTKRGGGIGPATDVWALGLIAYTLIVGRPYWLADDINQLYAEILVEPLESAVARAGRFGLGLPPAFDGWFFRCVNRDPSQRYPSASEAIAMLGMALGVSIDMPPSLPMGHPSHPSHPMIARASAVPTPHSIGAPMRSLPGQVTTGSPHLAASQVAARPPSGNGKLFAAIGAASLLLAVVAVVVARSGASTDEPDEPKPTKHKAKEDAAPVTVPLREKIERLNPFLGIGSAAMQRHEVTREEYAIFLSDLPEGDRAKWRPLSEWSTEKLDDDAKRLPVTWVSFERARRFCKAIDATLPTTEQWSEALDAKYPWGPDWPDDIAGLAIGKGEGAAPVAVETSKSDKTSDGIRDLAGNVQEWTSSVADGLATVRGGSTAMSAEDAKSAITEGR